MKVVRFKNAFRRNEGASDSSVREAMEERIDRAGSGGEGVIEQLRAQVAEQTVVIGLLAEALLSKTVDRTALAAELIPYGFDIELDE